MRSPLLLLAVAIPVGCGPERPPAEVTSPATTAVATEPAPSPPPARWHLMRGARWIDEAQAVGLSNGVRFVREPVGERVLWGEPPITRTWSMPTSLGGGYAYLSMGRGLYASDTPDGPLAPRCTLPGRYKSLERHPQGFFFELDGVHWVVAWPSCELSRPTPAGAVDVAVKSSRVAFVVDGTSEVWVTTDGGKTYRSHSPAVVTSDRPPSGSWKDPARLRITKELEAIIEADQGPASSPPLRPTFPPALLNIEQATPTGRGDVLVISEGKLHKVVPEVGGTAVSAHENTFNPDCVLFPTNDDVLAVCPGPTITRGMLAGNSSSEAAVPDRPLFGAVGSLIAAAPCDRTTTPKKYAPEGCLRDSKGEWHAVTTIAPNVYRWVVGPKGRSAAITLNGEVFVDGKKRPLSPHGATVVREVARGLEQESPNPLLSAKPLDQRFVLAPDGTVVGVDASRRRLLSISGAGELEAKDYDWIGFAWPHVLAKKGSEGWQSDDFGATFRPVELPPLDRFSTGGCSLAGCIVGGWVRVGWNGAAPTPETASTLASPSPLEPFSPPRVELACKPQGEPDEKTLAPNRIDADSVYWGTSKLPVRKPAKGDPSDGGVSAGRVKLWGDYAYGVPVWSHSYAVHTPPFSSRATPVVQRMRIARHPQDYLSASTLPVIPHQTKRPDTWLWGDVLLTPRGARSTQWIYFHGVSAVEVTPNQFAVLTDKHASGRIESVPMQIVGLKPTRTEPIYVPKHTDLLGLDAGGAINLIVLDGFGALAIPLKRGARQQLAGIETAVAGDDPACADRSHGLRTILNLRRRREQTARLAAVHWSSKRLCIDHVDEEGTSTRVVSFFPKREAHELTFDTGRQVVQPLSCELSVK